MPFVKENVAIEGAAALDDITLAAPDQLRLLPPFPEIAAQMTGSEWLHSLSGTGEREEAAHQQLQLVPLLSADFPQPL